MADSMCLWQYAEDWPEWSEWLTAGLRGRSHWPCSVIAFVRKYSSTDTSASGRLSRRRFLPRCRQL
jgi:hypothetical protein